MDKDLITMLMTILGTGIAVATLLYSFLASMRRDAKEGRKEYKEEMQVLETRLDNKWTETLKGMDAKWETLFSLYANKFNSEK